MIKSFASKDIEDVWNGEMSSKLPAHIQHTARRKLRMINSALTIQDLRIPPANRLKKLKGDLAGKRSVRINDQWRIVFAWRNGNAYEVEITDYHD